MIKPKRQKRSNKINKQRPAAKPRGAVFVIRGYFEKLYVLINLFTARFQSLR